MTDIRGRHTSEQLNAAAEMCHQIIVQDIFDGKMNYRDHARATFERHVVKIKDTIPPERLLVYMTGSGWKPICDFLGVPEPEDPYPLTNSTQEFRERVASRARLQTS